MRCNQNLGAILILTCCFHSFFIMHSGAKAAAKSQRTRGGSRALRTFLGKGPLFCKGLRPLLSCCSGLAETCLVD